MRSFLLLRWASVGMLCLISVTAQYRVVDLPTPITLPLGTYSLEGDDTAQTTDPVLFVNMNSFANDPATTGGRLTIGAPIVGGNNLLVAGVELGPMLFVSVPEPASCILLALAAAGLLGCRRVRSYSV